MSTVSVNISKLPIAKEINNGDYLIIDNGTQTSRLDFKDFIITSENTTFNGGSSTSVNNINALKNLSTSQLQTGAIVNVLGYYAAGDLGGGVFYYEPTAISNDNGGTIIRPNSGVGRWLRLLNGYSYVTPQMFGTKGDLVTDDRAAIQACIDAVTASTVKLSIKAIGQYLVSSRLIITSNFRSQFQGTNTGYGLPATVFHVDSTTEPLFELRSVVHATFSDFAVYFKRPTSNTITTDENAYCFLVKGWLYFSRIQNIDCFWSAGFLRCVPDNNYNSGESLMFSCWVSNVRSSFGRIGIEIGPGNVSSGGSGTSFNDVYLSNGNNIDYSIQAPAICAIKYGTSAVNDEWERLNVEWTRFSGDVVIISGQVHFASPHFEGLTFSADSSEHSFYSIINTGYSNVSIDDGIIQSSGKIFDIPGVTRVNIFKDGTGFGNNTLTVTNFEIYNLTTTVGTQIHRLRVERAMRFSGTGIREIETTFHDTSVNWDCMSEIPSCVSRTVNIEDHFVSGFATTMQRITAYGTPDGFVTERCFGQWNLSRFYTPPIPDIIADPFSPNKRVGVLRLQSGTIQYTSNTLSLPNTKIKIGQGPISIRVGFALSRFAINDLDDNYTFAIGLAENITNLYGKAIMFWVNPYTRNQVVNVGIRNPPTNSTDSAFAGGPISTPNTWNDFEMVLNPDATALSFWVASRDGRGQSVGGFVTSNAIPVGADLIPFITMQKSGSAAATNDIAYVDYFRVSYQPIGLNGV